MKKFENPEIEIIDIAMINIVTTSATSGENPGDPSGLLSKSADNIYGD